MARIYPFRALRYDPAKVSPAQVVTQPYDKITPAMQDRYYAASPYNLVRIILGKAEPGDDEHNNVYSRAAASLQHWRAEQVLVRDAEPSIYLYTQTFKVPGKPAETQLDRILGRFLCCTATPQVRPTPPCGRTAFPTLKCETSTM